MKTLKIKLRCSAATAQQGWDKGEVVDWPAEDAERLIQKGLAERVEEDQAPKRK